MSYQVFCTFDLKNASSQDYAMAYARLKELGLSRVHASTIGQAVIPTTSAMGTYDGTDVHSVRDRVRNNVKAAFQALRLKSEIFVTVGENGTWGTAAT